VAGNLLVATYPADPTPAPTTDGWIMPRTTKHIVRLAFTSALTAPTAGQVTMKRLIANAVDPTDVLGGGNFTFVLEAGPNGPNTVLKLEDTGNHITDRAWYQVASTNWPDADGFEIKIGQVAGDASNDRRANATDLAFINARTAPTPGVPWSWTDVNVQNRFRANVNGDNFVNSTDLSVTNARNNALAVNPPAGHVAGIIRP